MMRPWAEREKKELAKGKAFAFLIHLLYKTRVLYSEQLVRYGNEEMWVFVKKIQDIEDENEAKKKHVIQDTRHKEVSSYYGILGQADAQHSLVPVGSKRV